MGKYDEVNRGLQREPQTEDRSEGRQRVDALKSKLANAGEATPATLSRRYVQVREQKDAVEELLKPINEELLAVTELLIEAYEEAGITKVRVAETGQSVSVELLPIPQVKDREALRRWFVANGMEEALAPHSGTLASLVKELLLDGKPLPEGVEAYVRAKLVLRSQ